MRCSEQRFTICAVLLTLVSLLIASNAMAATDLHDASASFTGLLDLLQNSAAHWDAKLKGYAKTLFWLLATIQLVWTFFPLVFRQADFGEIVGELIRFIMIIGFFYALLLFSADWSQAVIDSFRQAGATAAGLGTVGIRPGDIFGTAVRLATAVGQVDTWNPLTALLISLASLVVMLCFAFVAAFMGLTIIESYVVINASVLFMGFGASQWTREYALAIVRYAVSVGTKLFVLTLIVGLMMDSAKEWAAAYDAKDASMWTMVGLSLACAYLAKTIPELVASMINGSSAGGGSTLGGMAAAAVAGATAAVSSIATAGATGAVSAAGSGGGGLAGAINSSFAGSGSATATGAGAGAAGTTSSSLGARTGGNAAAKSAGVKVGGSASTGPCGPAQPPSQSEQQAVKQSGKAAQDNSSDQSKGNTGAARPQVGVPEDQGRGGDENRQSTPPTAADIQTSGEKAVSGRQLANTITQGMGILAAISVPGMEGAAGLSLGDGAPQPAPDADNRNTDSIALQEETQNVIRPAEAPTAKNRSTDSDQDINEQS